MTDQSEVNLIVVGAGPAGLSAILAALESGLESVVLVDPDDTELPPALEQPGLTVVRPGEIRGVKADDSHRATVVTDAGDIEGKAVVIAAPSTTRIEEPVDDRDVMLVGNGELGALTAMELVDSASNVVLTLGGDQPTSLSHLTRVGLLRMEAERRITVLWESRPAVIEPLGGHPMAYFEDGRTPDLQFDLVIHESNLAAARPWPIDLSGPTSESVWWVAAQHPAPDGTTSVTPEEVWESVRSARFPHLQPPRATRWGSDDDTAIERLRQTHYNATITHFDRAHSDLWVLRVSPDSGSTAFDAGCYTTLGLGYWEPRADGARDPGLDDKRERLIRRSYSISSPIFDHHGYLVDPVQTNELEFYIVLVPPSSEGIPALTPRLALKSPGDRMHLGRRMNGHYSLDPVTDPTAPVVFLSTGTGEAPHNAMITSLLRRGHTGPMVSVVSVRYRSDLAYVDRHHRLEERFPQYHYLPIATREPDEEKRYVQDVIRQDLLSDRFGITLDPEAAHVYLCGNPAMIGIPAWEEDQPVFPGPVGACQLLHERGFILDRRGVIGSVHYEKYW